MPRIRRIGNIARQTTRHTRQIPPHQIQIARGFDQTASVRLAKRQPPPVRTESGIVIAPPVPGRSGDRPGRPSLPLVERNREKFITRQRRMTPRRSGREYQRIPFRSPARIHLQDLRIGSAGHKIRHVPGRLVHRNIRSRLPDRLGLVHYRGKSDHLLIGRKRQPRSVRRPCHVRTHLDGKRKPHFPPPLLGQIIHPQIHLERIIPARHVPRLNPNNPLIAALGRKRMTVNAILAPRSYERPSPERTKVAHKRVRRLPRIKRRRHEPIHQKIIRRPLRNAKPNLPTSLHPPLRPSSQNPLDAHPRRFVHRLLPNPIPHLPRKPPTPLLHHKTPRTRRILHTHFHQPQIVLGILPLYTGRT